MATPARKPAKSATGLGSFPRPPRLRPHQQRHQSLRSPRPLLSIDPSLATDFETAPISEVTIQVPWGQLGPGPSGEYLDVIDVDPGSGCFYSPVDLNHPSLLAQNGLGASEGTPRSFINRWHMRFRACLPARQLYRALLDKCQGRVVGPMLAGLST